MPKIFSSQTDFVKALESQRGNERIVFQDCAFDFDFDLHAIATEYKTNYPNDNPFFAFQSVDELNDDIYKELLPELQELRKSNGAQVKRTLIVDKVLGFIGCEFKKKTSCDNTRFLRRASFIECRF